MIRLASPANASAVQAIYAPYVETTPISFQLTPPDAAEIAERLARTLKLYPWLVETDELGTVRAPLRSAIRVLAKSSLPMTGQMA